VDVPKRITALATKYDKVLSLNIMAPPERQCDCFWS